VEGREGISFRTGDANVLIVGTANLVIGEHLIDVYVHDYASLSLVHEVVPVVETLERVVNQYHGVALQFRDISHAHTSIRSYLILPDKSPCMGT